MATVTRAPLYCDGLAERPIIRVLLPGETAEAFQSAATSQLAREFFVQLDTPVSEHVRIEAPFKSGAIAVRAEAITTPATHKGRSGVLVRLTKLEPASFGVAIPPASAWPRPDDVIEVRRAPAISPVVKPTVPRTATPHVVRRVIEVEVDEDPAAEFAAVPTKTSPLSADLAKQLAPTPVPPPRAPAIIRRQTPSAGMAPMPKPVVKVTSTPPGDDEWSSDGPTQGPAISSTKPTPPAFPVVSKPPQSPAGKPKPVTSASPPPKAVPSIGARAPITPSKGQPTFTAAAPPKQAIDDDAAFDSAFASFEDDLSIPVEPAKPVDQASPRARADEITKPVPAPSGVGSKPLDAPKPSKAMPATTAAAPTAVESKTATTPSESKPVAAASASKPTPTPPGASKSSESKSSASNIAPAPGVSKANESKSSAYQALSAGKSASGATNPGESKSRAVTASGSESGETSDESKADPQGIGSSKSGDSRPVEAAKSVESSKPVEGARPVAAPITPTPVPGAVARASSEGALATARASELALARGEIEPIEATSTGPVAASRATSETAPRPRSKLPLIAGAIAAVIGIVVVIVLATRGGGGKPTTAPPSNKAEVDKHLSAAASRIADGKLVGRGGDAALDHLLAAKALAPDDPQVIAQLRALADTFEKLGDGAMKANDLAEAATHYQAAVNAEPDRASAKTKLADVENRVRGK